MFCANCGTKNDDSANFCVSCGAKLFKPQAENVTPAPAPAAEQAPVTPAPEATQATPVTPEATASTSTNTEGEEQGPWFAFSKAGFIAGIVCLCLFWVPGFCFVSPIPLVLSVLGKRSILKENRDQAEKGYKLSVIATALGLLAFFIEIIWLA